MIYANVGLQFNCYLKRFVSNLQFFCSKVLEIRVFTAKFVGGGVWVVKDFLTSWTCDT